MIDYSELDAEELADAYAALVIEKRNLAEREDQIKRELTDKLIDREPDETGLYRFAVGAFKLRKAGVKEKWDKDAILNDLYKVAVDGVNTHADIATGEVLGTPEFRVKDTFAKCFTITPKKTPLREYGFDVDEYITKEGEGQMTVQLMEV
jgi:hypothetical protein